MFGFSKGASTESIAKLVRSGKWDKIRKNYLNSDTETKVNLAKACGETTGDDSCNLLMELLNSEEEEVKIAALKSLTATGNDHCVSRIQAMMLVLPEDKTLLRSEMQNTLNNLRGKQ